MKKISILLTTLILAATIYYLLKGNTMNNINNETYTVIAPNGEEVLFDKETNLIVSRGREDNTTKYPDKKSQMLLSAREILDSSAYKDYKPSYFNPNSKNAYGQTDYLSFESWYKLSFKSNSKEISPWTKKEKAYYESLKDKRDRYIYLVKRSNLKCSMIEIPDDAIARVDERGRLTKPEYKEIYDTVERNKKTLKSNLFIGEWGICAGILGDVTALGSGGSGGFKARKFQRVFLAAQLGEVKALKYLSDAFKYYTYNIGLNKNLSRSLEYKALYENPPLDEYGMIPYLDEIIGSDFIMDFNRGGVVVNSDGSLHREIKRLVESEGKLLDPRDIDANETTREEFINYVKKELPEYAEIFYEKAFPGEFANKDISLYIDSTILESKIMSLTPPEGYPNAPYYNTPEELKRMYESGKLDKRLNPLTPTMYKPSFPKDLKDKIEEYAKEHNIKD